MIEHEATLAAIEQAGIWVISAEPALVARVQATLAGVAETTATFDLSMAASKEFPSRRPDGLKLVVLDVDRSLESALDVIRKLRKSRAPAPMIVLTETFSREFGAKIISQGVPYYFSHDYCEEEFLAVAQSLLKRSVA